MPIPTADLLDKESQHTTHATSSTGQTTESGSSSHSLGAEARNTADALQSSQTTEGDRALSRAEADRLYEERMEEEYAKREGGA